MNDTERLPLPTGPRDRQDPAGLSLHLLGTFTLERGGRALHMPLSTGRVLACLAEEGASTRGRLAGILWPDQPAARARADLRTALWRLQQTDRRLLCLDGDLVALGPEVRVDVHDAEAWIEAALRVSADLTAPPPPSPPFDLGGVLLPDWDDAWVDQPRERLRMLQIQALESVAETLIRRQRPREAMPYVLAVVHACPLRESAQHLLIQIHLAQGNVAEAIHHFEHYRASLRTELGIDPGARLCAVVSDAMAGHIATGA